MKKPLGNIFDPNAPFSTSQHFRPHWSQATAIAFITFRTADSIPKEVLKSWNDEKLRWLRLNANLTTKNWQQAVSTLSDDLRNKFRKRFERCREDFLDTCHGECVLRRRELAQIVADSLLHFDGERYQMGDFIVMPNHVHLLAAFPTSEGLRRQCRSWLHYTARHINLRLGRTGKFWQQEPFDHLVRSVSQYEYLRNYIRDNGVKAKLPATDYLYRSYD